MQPFRTIRPTDEYQRDEAAWKATLPLLQKTHPLLWNLTHAVRYELPQALVPQYSSQPMDADDVFARVIRWVPGSTQQNDVDSPHGQGVALVNWLQHQQKTFFVSRSLCEAFAQAPLPDDLTLGDLKFPYPAFKFYLPFGTVEEGGYSFSQVIVSSHPVGLAVGLPEPIVRELAAHEARTQGKPLPRAYHTALDWFKCLYFTSPHRTSLDTSLKIIQHATDDTGLRAFVAKMFALGDTDAETDALRRVQKLVFHLLIYFGSQPAAAQGEPQEIRPFKFVGGRIRPAILKARFLESKEFEPLPAPPHPVMESGRKLPMMLRSGHWKRQPHGPGNERRKLIWVSAYWTHGPEPI